jgi:hypothetical protein
MGSVHARGRYIFNFWFKSAYRNEHLTPRHWSLYITRYFVLSWSNFICSIQNIDSKPSVETVCLTRMGFKCPTCKGTCQLNMALSKDRIRSVTKGIKHNPINNLHQLKPNSLSTAHVTFFLPLQDNLSLSLIYCRCFLCFYSDKG